jgi:hypothetical protein
MLTQMISIVFRRMESDQVIFFVSAYLVQKETDLLNCFPEVDFAFYEFQVSVSTASSAVKDPHSSSTKESENGEISSDTQSDEKVTLGDALSMNRASEASPTSVEELQNLAGGADIKVLELVCLSLTLVLGLHILHVLH